MHYNMPEKPKHYDNYDAARYMWEAIHREQIKKGEKYPAPLLDSKWSLQMLVLHVMQENIDQFHYLTKLWVELEKLQEAIGHDNERAVQQNVQPEVGVSGEESNVPAVSGVDEESPFRDYLNNIFPAK